MNDNDSHLLLLCWRSSRVSLLVVLPACYMTSALTTSYSVMIARLYSLKQFDLSQERQHIWRKMVLDFQKKFQTFKTNILFIQTLSEKRNIAKKTVIALKVLQSSLFYLYHSENSQILPWKKKYMKNHFIHRKIQLYSCFFLPDKSEMPEFFTKLFHLLWLKILKIYLKKFLARFFQIQLLISV